ncbi:hypothetical protein TTHERM_00420450 (macronuclear) [Tetrahymena thermophila SB210]|uniref:Uncharacterized protein n=1 Tax=Tetrahymena thermophila (strain SB210) TaxID=312017 RepID=I7MH01_TETTS|nr:hypothetical protein TTHERM_00420450 [Tetrahymena thermophila SB210]EAR85637.2 hypothetical protein TTHERM_00420450 [Tetrahymena thermophila SB210]|eukprot:XP_001033300.2 hypothetical protein TTHERM_00420450 [Tetrahymena thermophila SB210]
MSQIYIKLESQENTKLILRTISNFKLINTITLEVEAISFFNTIPPEFSDLYHIKVLEMRFISNCFSLEDEYKGLLQFKELLAKFYQLEELILIFQNCQSVKILSLFQKQCTQKSVNEMISQNESFLQNLKKLSIQQINSFMDISNEEIADINQNDLIFENINEIRIIVQLCFFDSDLMLKFLQKIFKNQKIIKIQLDEITIQYNYYLKSLTYQTKQKEVDNIVRDVIIQFLKTYQVEIDEINFEILSDLELDDSIQTITDIYQQKLQSISIFMKEINIVRSLKEIFENIQFQVIKLHLMNCYLTDEVMQQLILGLSLQKLAKIILIDVSLNICNKSNTLSMKNSKVRSKLFFQEDVYSLQTTYEFLIQMQSKQLKNICLTTPCFDLKLEQQILYFTLKQGNIQKYELDFFNLMISSDRESITELILSYDCQKANVNKLLHLWKSFSTLQYLKSFSGFFSTQSQLDDQQTKQFFGILNQLKQLETLELTGPNLLTEKKQEEYLEVALKNQINLKVLNIKLKFLQNVKICNICQSISQGLQYQTNLISLTIVVFSDNINLQDGDSLFNCLKYLLKLEYLKIVFKNIMASLNIKVKENYKLQENLFSNLKYLKFLKQLEINFQLNSSFDCDQIILDSCKLPSIQNLRLNLGEQHYTQNSYSIKQSLQSILTGENQDNKNLSIYIDVNNLTFYFLRENYEILLNAGDCLYKNSQLFKNNFEQDIQFQNNVLQSLIQYDNLKDQMKIFNFQMININLNEQDKFINQYYELSNFLQKYNQLQYVSLSFKMINLDLLVAILETCSAMKNLVQFKINTSFLFEQNSSQTDENIQKIKNYVSSIYQNCKTLNYLEFQNQSNLIENNFCQTTKIKMKLDLLHSFFEIKVLICFLPQLSLIDSLKLDIYPQNQTSSILLDSVNLISPLINSMSKLAFFHTKLISTFNANLQIPASFLQFLKIQSCLNQYSLSFPQVEFKFLQDQPIKQGCIQILLYDCSSIVIVNEFLKTNQNYIFEISLILKCKKLQEKVGIGEFIKQLSTMKMLQKFIIQSDSKIFRYNRTFNYLFVFSLFICYRQFCRQKLLNQSIAFKKLNQFYRSEIYYDMIKLGLTPQLPQIDIQYNDFIESFVGGQIGFENVGEEDFLDVNRFIIYTEPISIDQGNDSFAFQFLNASDKNVQLDEFFM